MTDQRPTTYQPHARPRRPRLTRRRRSVRSPSTSLRIYHHLPLPSRTATSTTTLRPSPTTAQYGWTPRRRHNVYNAANSLDNSAPPKVSLLRRRRRRRRRGEDASAVMINTSMLKTKPLAGTCGTLCIVIKNGLLSRCLLTTCEEFGKNER